MAEKRGSRTTHPTVTAPHTLEFAPSCKQLSLVLLGMLVISFTVTWYKVWWDSLIGVGVMAYGYWALRDTNPANLDPARVRHFHYGMVLSLVCHIIALGEVTYFVIKVYLLDKIIDVEDGPGVPLFVFLYLYLLIEIGVTSFGVERTYNLCQEISRNEYFLQSEARVLMDAGSAPSSPESGLAKQQQENERDQEEYLAGVQRRIESYENCAAAISAATTSLQELSRHLDAMQQATQQLNAFTGGWLAVWKRPST
eukprot:jgi/Phyca11/537597/estExt2_fgenesh1_pg.C_PHYCAscaffold_1000019